MQLVTEEQGTIEGIRPLALRETLETDAFGSFAVLQASDDEFLQAGNNWDPSPDCAAFLEKHGSDPWLIEFRDPRERKLFRAGEDLTLSQVIDVFLAYLGGDMSWRARFTWSEVKL